MIFALWKSSDGVGVALSTLTEHDQNEAVLHLALHTPQLQGVSRQLVADWRESLVCRDAPPLGSELLLAGSLESVGWRFS